MNEKPVSLKLEAALFQLASDVSQLTRETFKDLVTKALEREIQHRLKRDGGRLSRALDAMREYREGLDGAASTIHDRPA
jgi:hypothetical protein